jgi:parvulin-like peptidyl-prolyl isomerase
MAFPWNRRDPSPGILPQERRRRSRNRRDRREEAVRESAKLSQEKKHQRLVWAIGSALILIIAGVVAAGFYQQFYHPPRVWAGNVRDVEFTMGDLVERIRVLQGLTGQVDLSIVPFEYLQNQLIAEILRQASPGMGINITAEDLDEALRDQFLPRAAAGDEVAPGQLDEEFRQSYSAYLTRTGLSDEEYRVILEEQIAQFQLRTILAASIAAAGEQVEVEWIRLEPTGTVIPAEVRSRLDIEEFGAVAAEVGTPDGFAGPSGYVGWVPRGAFPDLDEVMFGDEESEVEPLAVGDISPPFSTFEGIYIIHKLSPAEDREISDRMRSKLLSQVTRQWELDQLATGSQEGWLKMNFNSKWYAWVAEQVKISAPRTPQGRQGSR